MYQYQVDMVISCQFYTFHLCKALQYCHGLLILMGKRLPLKAAWKARLHGLGGEAVGLACMHARTGARSTTFVTHHVTYYFIPGSLKPKMDMY